MTNENKIKNKENTCLKTLGEKFPITDKSWSYTVNFECGNGFSEVADYSFWEKPVLESDEFVYCPFCGKRIRNDEDEEVENKK